MTARDWLSDDDKKIQTSNNQARDWLSEPEQEEAFYKQPLRDIGIGLAHAGRNLHNLPHDLAHGVDVAGSAIGRLFGAPEFQNNNSNLASYFPNDEEDYSNVFGQKGEPTFSHKAIQKGIEFAPDIIGGINALRSIGLLPHLTRRGASAGLRNARQLGVDRQIGNLDVNPHLIEDLRQYQPSNTIPYRNQMDRAHTGDYQSLFDLQSDVGKAAAEDARWAINSTSATRRHGREGLQARHRLIEDIHRDLQSKGHHDISNALRQGQEDYRRYARFRPYRNMIGSAAGTAVVASLLPKNALVNLIQKIVMHNGS